MIDVVALQMVLSGLTGWLNRREREAIAYLIEENRLLRRQLVVIDCASPTTIAVGWPHLAELLPASGVIGRAMEHYARKPTL